MPANQPSTVLPLTGAARSFLSVARESPPVSDKADRGHASASRNAREPTDRRAVKLAKAALGRTQRSAGYLKVQRQQQVFVWNKSSQATGDKISQQELLLKAKQEAAAAQQEVAELLAAKAEADAEAKAEAKAKAKAKTAAAAETIAENKRLKDLKKLRKQQEVEARIEESAERAAAKTQLDAYLLLQKQDALKKPLLLTQGQKSIDEQMRTCKMHVVQSNEILADRACREDSIQAAKLAVAHWQAELKRLKSEADALDDAVAALFALTCDSFEDFVRDHADTPGFVSDDIALMFKLVTSRQLAASKAAATAAKAVAAKAAKAAAKAKAKAAAKTPAQRILADRAPEGNDGGGNDEGGNDEEGNNDAIDRALDDAIDHASPPTAGGAGGGAEPMALSPAQKIRSDQKIRSGRAASPTVSALSPEGRIAPFERKGDLYPRSVLVSPKYKQFLKRQRLVSPPGEAFPSAVV